MMFFIPCLSPAKTVTIKYSDHDPPAGIRPQFVKNVWLSEIAKQTGGKVKIQDFWGGALLKSKEILSGIRDGVTNMGFVSPSHYPGRLTAFSIFRLCPRGPQKFENIAWFYHQVYEQIPEFKAQMKKVNQKTLLFTIGLPSSFTGKNPLSSLDGLKGDKWRAAGKWRLRFLKNAGAVPVSVSWGDVYMALQTGTIDGVLTNYDGAHMMKFDEAAPNILVSKELWNALPFIHNVNLDFWNSLPKDVQKGILKASEIAEQKYAKIYEESFDKIVAEQRASGYKVTMMSKEDIQKWENAKELEKMHEQWVKEAAAAGLKRAPDIMKKVQSLLKQAIERDK